MALVSSLEALETYSWIIFYCDISNYFSFSSAVTEVLFCVLCVFEVPPAEPDLDSSESLDAQLQQLQLPP